MRSASHIKWCWNLLHTSSQSRCISNILCNQMQKFKNIGVHVRQQSNRLRLSEKFYGFNSYFVCIIFGELWYNKLSICERVQLKWFLSFKRYNSTLCMSCCLIIWVGTEANQERCKHQWNQQKWKILSHALYWNYEYQGNKSLASK